MSRERGIFLELTLALSMVTAYQDLLLRKVSHPLLAQKCCDFIGGADSVVTCLQRLFPSPCAHPKNWCPSEGECRCWEVNYYPTPEGTSAACKSILEIMHKEAQDIKLWVKRINRGEVDIYSALLLGFFDIIFWELPANKVEMLSWRAIEGWHCCVGGYRA